MDTGPAGNLSVSICRRQNGDTVRDADLCPGVT